MNDLLFIDILYQIHLLEKLLEKEQSPFKRLKYEGMMEAFMYILRKEEDL